mmetsp:Transcript_47780/g.63119  ORF Transcript_47780/g.63119 Transcript_47780/m.63119 type:complete len:116 (+) Transcript_47780:291-638(+)|eukprot:CAMPEP_0170463688 /NCGR_PEP_ID=MMETSP0123-20130129/8705_1 /TAXON_ID=182087 /ORGANISM="Favella ehrenbergii, Strain Fehren 1" /LENGTH=115 /DNA_ID=CAMNT_0010729181 /DNA_START=295 /DNA_END=642 /DNA_ORIENTATION=-
MKPKILDPWTASRVQQPERAYTKFFASRQKPFAFTDNNLENFGAPSEKDGMSTRYTELLAEQKKKYREWVLQPSKFEPEAKEPLCMTRRTKMFKAGSIEGTGKFGFGSHTPWEEF